MTPILFYLTRMIMIAASLFGYYRLFLRNAPCHAYNRWYLLGSVFLSLAAPLVPMALPVTTPTAFLILTGKNGVASTYPLPTPAPDHPVPSLLVYVAAAYAMVAGSLLFRSLYPLRALYRMTRQYIPTRTAGILLYRTDAAGTPFSFFDRLFWNDSIPIESEKGQTILRHEYFHIRSRHTMDILILTIVRSVFWCNPFFCLTLRELRAVHEFLADRYALSGSPVAADMRSDYAEWLVWQSLRQPGSQSLTHSFYHNHLKRRIAMILQSPGVRPSYWRRIAAFPLALLLFCGFADTTACRQTSLAQGASVPDPHLFRFYLHWLRYPASALQQGLEQSVSFSIRIGEHNQLLEFKSYPQAPNTRLNKITVAAIAKDVANGDKFAGDRTALFIREVKVVSEKLPTETSSYAPGEYFFTVQFRIERPEVAATGK